MSWLSVKVSGSPHNALNNSDKGENGDHNEYIEDVLGDNEHK
jgi:hypothetical protein